MGHAELFGGKLHGVGNPFVACSSGTASVAATMVQGRANMPTVHASGGPAALLVWFLMDDCFGTRWCEWSDIAVEVSVKLRAGGEVGIDSGTMEEVERNQSVWNEAVPQVQRELGMCGTQSGDEVIREILDCVFCGVASMTMGRC